MDFNIKTYTKFLESLIGNGYNALKFVDYIINRGSNSNYSMLILRHDVDLLPSCTIKIAKLEKSLGIKGSYYFRTIPETFIADVIREVASLGHEVGYHYEVIDTVTKNYKSKILNEENKDEIISLAYDEFKKQLMRFNEVVDVKTICMHGSPRGKYDNKMIWEKYDYKELGIIGEPYLDIDWDEFGYLTDTGRRWNGEKYSLRDKVNSKYKFDFKTTDDIINNVDKLPDKLMITVHPQRWTNNPVLWTRELVLQNIKNVVKYYKVKNKK